MCCACCRDLQWMPWCGGHISGQQSEGSVKDDGEGGREGDGHEAAPSGGDGDGPPQLKCLTRNGFSSSLFLNESVTDEVSRLAGRMEQKRVGGERGAKRKIKLHTSPSHTPTPLCWCKRAVFVFGAFS